MLHFLLGVIAAAGGVEDDGTLGSSTQWRARSLSVPDASFFEISELGLFVGSTRQTDGTMSSSNGVSGGSLAMLNDGNTSTAPYWPVATVEDPAFWIQWTFPSAQSITGIAQAGFDNNARHSTRYRVEWWNGSAWVHGGTVTGLAYPGNNTLSSVYAL